MTINQALFSSRSEEWETPQAFFDALNTEFDNPERGRPKYTAWHKGWKVAGGAQ